MVGEKGIATDFWPEPYDHKEFIEIKRIPYLYSISNLSLLKPI
jgi:hypothetical protein